MTGTSKFMMPGMSLMGSGALADAGTEIGKLGFKHVLIVTDKPLVDIGIVKKVTSMLDSLNVKSVVYSARSRIPRFPM
ncbi:iron-containing alcohol dehydrogenase [Paenibacillus sp. NRS-1781]|uniref:iron-containing alcohol dehydrogenase n=1 Tax=Paenibacillus sp. NRS-1781 TaxID=3233905 RepID=UPI003D2C5616